MTSHLSENEADNLQNGDLLEVSDGFFFALFTLFHLSLTFFVQSFPLKVGGGTP